MIMPLSLSQDEFDQLPFGIIRIDSDGQILEYNAFESRLSGLPPESVIGKNFFCEIAPCTNVADFRGRFEAARTEPQINLQFSFVFPFEAQTRRVFIHILAAPAKSFWIFVSDSASDRTISTLLYNRSADSKRDASSIHDQT